MATRQETADFILDQLHGTGAVTTRKMFGEYGLYCNGKIVALICDDQLFVKPTPKGLAHAGPITMASPYPGAKPHLLISEDRLDDGEWLSQLVRLTADSLPPPKPKKKAKPKKR